MKQSLNIHIAEPNSARLTSMHFYGWKKGLKTGMYYLRTKPAADAIKFTVDGAALAKAKAQVKQSNGGESPSAAQLVAAAAKLDPSISASNAKEMAEMEELRLAQMACSLANPGNCEACGS